MQDLVNEFNSGQKVSVYILTNKLGIWEITYSLFTFYF